MLSVLLIIAVAVSAIFLFLLWQYSYWYRQGIPQGNPLKLCGDMNDIIFTSGPHFDEYIASSRRFTGKPFYGVYNMARPRIVVRNTEMINEVLVKKFSSFADTGFEVDRDNDPIVGRDPFFQTGENWKESRNTFTALMTPRRLRNMLLQTEAVSKDAVAYLKSLKHESGKGDGANVKNFAVRFVTDLLVRATLSAEAGSFKEEKNVFMEAGERMFNEFLQTFLSMFKLLFGLVMSWVPILAPYLTESVMPKAPVIILENIIKKEKNYRIENGITRDDILDVAMKRKATKNESGAVKTDNKEDSDIDIVAMIILFFWEGFETTTTTMSAAITELARNVEFQDKLRRQILAACPPGKDITEEALSSVPLLHQAFIEALRLYPPGLMMQRVATNDVILRASTGEEVFLKKGTPIHIPLGGYHRDPEFFSDPDNYNPERFNDETEKRSFIGFGNGPRQCPGQNLAALAGKVLLAAILREFKLELAPKTIYPPQSLDNSFMFVLKDDAIWVRFVPL